jgi:hypothetical protein
MRTPDVRMFVVLDGREWPGCFMLDPGARITMREYDAERQAYVVHAVSERVGVSHEVATAESEDRDRKPASGSKEAEEDRL